MKIQTLLLITSYFLYPQTGGFSFNHTRLNQPIYTHQSPVALPLEFISFRADESTINLRLVWVVQESDVDYYEVERSTNATQYTVVTKTNPRSNTASVEEYAIEDPAPNMGNNYYRVKVYRKNADPVYSVVIRVFYGRIDNNLIVYPNPVKKKTLQVRLVGLNKGKFEMRILSEGGQSLQQRTIQHDGSDHIETINLPQTIQKGKYYVYISNGIEFYKGGFVVE
jgi:hypothetical protein